jgi:hypothetical protein
LNATTFKPIIIQNYHPDAPDTAFFPAAPHLMKASPCGSRVAIQRSMYLRIAHTPSSPCLPPRYVNDVYAP